MPAAHWMLNYLQVYNLSTRVALAPVSGLSVLVVLGAMLLPVWARAAPDVLGALPQEWRDDGGGEFDLTLLRGHPVVFAMAYASCRRVCPMTMESLNKVQRALDDRRITADVIIVGYDPGDDPATWRHYRKSRHLTRPNWHFLSGREADIGRFARALGFEYWKYDEHVMHDFKIVFVSAEGRVVDGLTWSNREQDLSAQSGPACHFLNPSGSCP
jgi:cytochrome oxidase Cu insertion factor (SCO1/SenC/PrrC family)